MHKILDGVHFVAKNSTHVRVSEGAALKFARDYKHGLGKHWFAAAPIEASFFYLFPEEALHFLFIFNALGFSYWGEPKWTVEYEGRHYDGAWGMIAAIKRALKDGIPLFDFAYCAKVTENEVAHILRANTEIPLLRERTRILSGLGETAVRKFDGKLANLVRGAGKDAVRLLNAILENFPSFEDSNFYKIQQVYFEKRAQLLVADISQLFFGAEFGDLARLDELTACADYKLPQLLRRLGVLVYSPELAAKVDAKVELPAGSEEEIEIRANTVWAVELIKEEAKKRNPGITSVALNDDLWLRTQEKLPDEKPYHRTRTIAY